MKKSSGFDLDEYKSCANCINVTELSDGDFVLCKKHGLVKRSGECKHFEIDLLSLRPKKLRRLKPSFTEEDFEI